MFFICLEFEQKWVTASDCILFALNLNRNGSVRQIAFGFLQHFERLESGGFSALDSLNKADFSRIGKSLITIEQ